MTQEFMLKIFSVQQKLSVPKTQSSKNKNGAEMFKFRDYPQIIETLKPLLAEQNLIVISNSEIVQLGERYYVKATVSIKDVKNFDVISASALAREEILVGMNAPQSSGSAESYALKRAISGLLAIDDGTKDPDTTSEGKDWLTKVDDALWNAGIALNKAETVEELSVINKQYAWLSESKMYGLFMKRAKERISKMSNNQKQGK